MVGEYQVKNLPCPAFSHHEMDADGQMRKAALSAIQSGNLDDRLNALRPGLREPPYTVAVRHTVVALVRRIIQAEEARGEISRSKRSALCPEAQPCQDLIDRLLYAMAGLTDEEARGSDERLANML
jgi:hypothetical protein